MAGEKCPTHFLDSFVLSSDTSTHLRLSFEINIRLIIFKFSVRYFLEIQILFAIYLINEITIKNANTVILNMGITGIDEWVWG